MYYSNQAKQCQVGRGRKMNIKGLLGKGKEPPLQIEAATKPEPVVKADCKKRKESTPKANAGTKWNPKPAGKGTKRTKRF